MGMIGQVRQMNCIPMLVVIDYHFILIRKGTAEMGTNKTGAAGKQDFFTANHKLSPSALT